jgi:MSHA biogenesis protein MshG
MPNFAYRGRNASGELVRGIVESTDSGAVADQLINTGVSPLDITLSKSTVESTGDNWSARLLVERVSLEDLLLFSRQMHTLLRAGVPILRALAGLQESSSKIGFATVLQDMRVSLDSGRELHVAMRRHPRVFTQFYVSMVRVGEMTGRLEQVFLLLFNHLEFEKDIKDKVSQALNYPTFVLVVMGIALIIVNIFVIPAFAKMFAGFKVDLPIMTRILLEFSGFMVNNWVAMLLTAVGGTLAFVFYVGSSKGRYVWDRFKLRIPIAGKIVLKATLARFARALSLALRSGVPMVQSMAVVAQTVDNAYIAQRIEQMRAGVERGESVYRTAMTAGVFTPVVLQMIAVGEESGELKDLLSEVADMYQKEVEYDLKNLSGQIEPVLVIFLGILVLMLALGVFLPIWDLSRVATGNPGG